jgi:cyclopropane-fatty-acyl-phospholipid synthase
MVADDGGRRARFDPPAMGIEGLSAPPAQSRLDGWTGLLLAILKRTRAGGIAIELADGRRFDFAGDRPGPRAILRVNRERMARRLLTDGDVGFAESYMDGDWETPDLGALIEFAAINADVLDRHLRDSWHGRLLRRALHIWRRNDRRGSQKNIAYHYDLGNEFYRHWLDPSMTYSSAVFEEPKYSLEQAQVAKYRRLARAIGLDRRHRVLEIGCGWGAFAETAAREHGCQVIGITLSKAQQVYAEMRVRAAGLADRISIRLQDYRDIRERFDRIVSIEMFEAVGEAYWPLYFAKLKNNLTEGGMAALQIITIAEERFDAYRQRPDFIQRYIFPGGMLPTVDRLKSLAADVGLEWRVDHGFGRHYAETLRQWGQRFAGAWPAIQALGYDERFRRMWQYYLGYCEGGFRAASVDVRQIVLQRA